MAKIICSNARINKAEGYAPQMVCNPDCPICDMAGYTEAKVVEAKHLKSLKSHIEGMRLPNDHSANGLIDVMVEKIDCILKEAQ